MITALTPPQIDAYERDGYLLLPGFLDGGELERWPRAVDDGLARLVGNADPDIKLFDNQDRDDFYRDVFVQCVNMWKGSEQVRELVLDQRLGRLAAELVGAPGMRLYHDHALVKNPWANPTNWHLDNPSDPYFSHQSTMLWIALDAATLQNGCLYFLPGSHKSSRFERVPALSETRIDALFEHYPEWRGIDPVAVEARAGDAVFISGLIAHAAGPNMSRRPRRAFAILFMPEGATFSGRQSALPDAVFSRLEVGDVIADDEHLPLLWSRN